MEGCCWAVPSPAEPCASKASPPDEAHVRALKVWSAVGSPGRADCESDWSLTPSTRVITATDRRNGCDIHIVDAWATLSAWRLRRASPVLSMACLLASAPLALIEPAYTCTSLQGESAESSTRRSTLQPACRSGTVMSGVDRTSPACAAAQRSRACCRVQLGHIRSLQQCCGAGGGHPCPPHTCEPRLFLQRVPHDLRANAPASSLPTPPPSPPCLQRGPS